MVDVDRQRWDEENVRNSHNQTHETKAKGDGKRRKRENIVKKAPKLYYFGWVLCKRYTWHVITFECFSF